MVSPRASAATWVWEVYVPGPRRAHRGAGRAADPFRLPAAPGPPRLSTAAARTAGARRRRGRTPGSADRCGRSSPGPQCLSQTTACAEDPGADGLLADTDRVRDGLVGEAVQFPQDPAGALFGRQEVQRLPQFAHRVAPLGDTGRGDSVLGRGDLAGRLQRGDGSA